MAGRISNLASLQLHLGPMMRKAVLRPYLIEKEEEGRFRITVRTTRFNSQGYPLTTSHMLDGRFPSLNTARAYVREQFRAEATDIATK